MKTGRLQGIVSLIVAALFTGLYYAAISEGYIFPFIIICIPTFLLTGLGLIFFPGQAVGKEARKNVAVFWNGGSKVDKIVWVSSLVIGMGIGFYLFFINVDINSLV